MDIRLLQEGEIPACAELAQGVFGFDLQRTIKDGRLIEGFYDYANEGSLTNRLRCGQIILWGVFEGTQMCGISAMQPEGHITMLYVYPAFRERGYGKALLKTMRTFAKSRLGLARVTASAMPAWTATFFTRNGFSALGLQPHSEFVNLEAETGSASMYPVRKLGAGRAAVLALITAALILAVSIGFLCLYTPAV